MMIVHIKTFEMDKVMRSETLRKTLRKLTLGPGSGMNYALDGFEETSKIQSIKAKAIIVYHKSQAIAWALLTNDRCIGYYNYDYGDDSHCFQVFVDPLFRRKGIGSVLAKKALKLIGNKKLRVYESDAPKFFNVHRRQSGQIINIWTGQ